MAMFDVTKLIDGLYDITYKWIKVSIYCLLYNVLNSGEVWSKNVTLKTCF